MTPIITNEWEVSVAETASANPNQSVWRECNPPTVSSPCNPVIGLPPGVIAIQCIVNDPFGA